MSSIDDESSQGQLKAIEDAVLMSASGSWTIENPGHGDLPVSARSHCILQKDDLVLISSGTGASMLLVIEPKQAPMSLADAIDGKYSDDQLVVLRKFWSIEDKQTRDECLTCAWCLFNVKQLAAGVRDIDSASLASIVKKLTLQGKTRTRKRDPGKAADYPLPTSLEAVAFAAFMADAPTKSNMQFDEAGLYYKHQRQNSQYGVIVRSSEASPESALDELDGSLQNLGKDAIMNFSHCLTKLVDEEGGHVDIGYGELAELHGRKRKMSEAEGDEFARRMEYQLKLFESFEPWAVKGWRYWNDSDGKRIKVQQTGALIKFYAPFYRHNQPPLPGQWKRPEGWTLLSTPWIEMFRKDPTLLPYIGRLKSISQIPTGKMAGDWAQSMALYIAIQGRRNAKNSGRVVKIKRVDLLTQYQPKPENAPEAILERDNPNRARKCFAEAMELLKGDQGKKVNQVISDFKDPDDPKTRGRQGWSKDWLNDVIEITLSDDFGAWPEQRRQKELTKKDPKKARKSPNRNQEQG